MREISLSRSVPGPKGSLSIQILLSISVTIVFIALKTRIWHTQYTCKCTEILQGIKKPKEELQFYMLIYCSLYTFFFLTGLYQHPSLYRGIVKVTWRVFNQLNVWFLFWYAITNFSYDVTSNIFQNTTKRKELFSLKETTFVYVLSSDWWITGLTPEVQNAGY